MLAMLGQEALERQAGQEAARNSYKGQHEARMLQEGLHFYFAA